LILSLVLLLAITIIATYWARYLAKQRGRHIGAWALATAALPPVVLLLWALPPRQA